jgi:uncharacterized protein YndB with AHSA1/START domain
METIYHQILINSTPDVVFKAVTTQEGISKWWLFNCIVKPEMGFINEFRYKNYVHNKMKVIDLQPNKRVEWECIQSDPQWIGTHIIFDISVHNEFVKLNFIHTNWQEQTDFFAACNYHWARHLTMLKNYCESGNNQVDEQVESQEIKRVKGLK